MSLPPSIPYANPNPAPAPGPGLSAEQIQQLADARKRLTKIRRAVFMAHFDFWGTAIFAGLTLAGSLIAFSWSGMFVGLAMAIVAYVELTGAKALKRLDERAPKRLAMNQLFFGAALLIYAVWSLWTGWRNPGELSGMVASELPNDPGSANILGSINDLTRLILIVLYGTLAAVAITVQGGTALFYFSRARHLRDYLSATPEWILEAQRAGVLA